MKSDLWPEDITSEAVLSPARILLDQVEALAARTNGLLKGQVRKREDGDRVILGFEIVPHNVDTRVRLFEVHHRAEFGYPAAIILPKAKLPAYLKKERYVPSKLGIAEVLSEVQGEWVENEWVATSPQEFSERIADVFSLPHIKTRVLSLLARANEAVDESGLIKETENEAEEFENDKG